MEKTQLQCLRALPREAVTNLAFRLQLEPCAKLSKAAMARRVMEAMDASPSLVRFCMGEPALSLLRKMTSRKGGESGAFPQEALWESIRLQQAMRELTLWGLVWGDREGWHAVPEARRYARCGPEEREQLRLSSQLLERLEALLSWYALLSPEEALSRLPERADLSPEDLLALSVRCVGLNGVCHFDKKVYLLSRHVDDPQALWESWQQPEVRELAWASPVPRTSPRPSGSDPWETVIMELSIYHTQESTVYSLVNYILECSDDARTGAGLIGFIAEAVDAAQQGSDEEAAEILLQLTGRPDDRLPFFTQTFLSDLPRWRYKGRSRREMERLTRPEDSASPPCPCGSGKPYLLCHGRRN